MSKTAFRHWPRWAAACVFSVSGGMAAAHPHVFADTKVTFLVGADNLLTGLQVVWTYDELTSLVLLDTLDLDRDRDGVLDDADRAAIVAGETDWPPDYNGDIHLTGAAGDIPMGRPMNGAAWQADDRISVSFDLPFAQPMPPKGVTAELRFYDPMYYYAYTVVSVDGAATGCRVDLIPFEPDAAAAELQAQLALLSQEDVPEIENVGALFADRIVVACD